MTLAQVLTGSPKQSPANGHPLSPKIVEKIKKELARLSGPDKMPHVRQFVKKMYTRYPQLAEPAEGK